ncbi:hypothetical protein MTR67_043990, partial [Solanum verrucosum]
QRDARHETKNSGVTVVASTTSFASLKDKNRIAADLTYYGRIVDIIELDYYDHFKEEPFVLGSQVHQCFYVQDPYDQDIHYVMKTVPRDLFDMDNGEVLLTRTDVPETIIDVPSEEFVTQQLEVEYEEKFEDESTDEFEDECENEYEDELEDEFEDDAP